MKTRELARLLDGLVRGLGPALDDGAAEDLRALSGVLRQRPDQGVAELVGELSAPPEVGGAEAAPGPTAEVVEGVALFQALRDGIDEVAYDDIGPRLDGLRSLDARGVAAVVEQLGFAPARTKTANLELLLRMLHKLKGDRDRGSVI